jgi:hypothetical protein
VIAADVAPVKHPLNENGRDPNISATQVPDEQPPATTPEHIAQDELVIQTF